MNFKKLLETADSLEAAVYAVVIDSKNESEANLLARKSKSVFLTLIAKRQKRDKPLGLDELAFELLNNAIEYVDWVQEEQGEFIFSYPKE
jgi:hypothetical protein